MAKQIHILEQSGVQDGQRTIKCVFWFPIAGAAKVPKPGYVSFAPAVNVSAADQSALEDGSVLEETVLIPFPTSYSTTQLKAIINARYTDRAAALALAPAARAFYGVFYDSVTAWSA